MDSTSPLGTSKTTNVAGKTSPQPKDVFLRLIEKKNSPGHYELTIIEKPTLLDKMARFFGFSTWSRQQCADFFYKNAYETQLKNQEELEKLYHLGHSVKIGLDQKKSADVKKAIQYIEEELQHRKEPI